MTHLLPDPPVGSQPRKAPPESVLAAPRTFGHGGIGSSSCWADPDSGVSSAYLTNNRVPDPWNGRRMDIISNLVHAAID